MKKHIVFSIFLTLFAFLTQLLYAEEEASYPDINPYYDYIQVFAREGSDYLREGVELFSDPKMQGRPVIKILPDRLIDVKNNKIVLLKELIAEVEKKPKSKTPYDFLVVLAEGAYLKLENYKNNIAEVKSKNEHYYFKLGKSNFKSGGWPIQSFWRTITDSEKGLEFIKNLEKEDKVFFELLEKIRKCLREKDADCFLSHSQSTKQNFENEFLVWGMANNEIACEKFGPLFDTGDKRQKALGIKPLIPWDFLEKIFTLKAPNSEFKVVQREFGEFPRLEIKATGDCACENCLESEFFLTKEKNNSWKLYFPMLTIH